MRRSASSETAARVRWVFFLLSSPSLLGFVHKSSSEGPRPKDDKAAGAARADGLAVEHRREAGDVRHGREDRRLAVDRVELQADLDGDRPVVARQLAEQHVALCAHADPLLDGEVLDREALRKLGARLGRLGRRVEARPPQFLLWRVEPYARVVPGPHHRVPVVGESGGVLVKDKALAPDKAGRRQRRYVERTEYCRRANRRV